MSVIGEYDDEVLERRKRTVHVVEDRTAGISAWHGGFKVADLGGWASVSRAIAEAQDLARRYGVTPASTMRIRIEETTRHSWTVVRGRDGRGHPEYEYGTFVREPLVTLNRHVWDDVDGIVVPAWRNWTFHAEEWIGLKGDPPEASAIAACYTGLSVVVADERSLFRLFGLGTPVMTGVEVRSEPPPPFIREQRERGVLSYLRVRLKGTCPVTSAPGTDEAAIAGFLSTVEVRSVCDKAGRDMLDGVLKGHIRWSRGEDETSCWMPAIPSLEFAGA